MGKKRKGKRTGLCAKKCRSRFREYDEQKSLKSKMIDYLIMLKFRKAASNARWPAQRRGGLETTK